MPGLNRINFPRYITPVFALATAMLIGWGTIALARFQLGRTIATFGVTLTILAISAVAVAPLTVSDPSASNELYRQQSLILGVVPSALVLVTLITLLVTIRYRRDCVERLPMALGLCLVAELTYFVRYGLTLPVELIRLGEIAAICIAAILLLLGIRRTAIATTLVAIAMPAVLLVTVDRHMSSQADVYADPPPHVQFLQAAVGPQSENGRTISSINVLSPNINNGFEIYDVTSMNPQQVDTTAAYLFRMLAAKPISYITPNAWPGIDSRENSGSDVPTWIDYTARRSFYNLLSVKMLADNPDGWLSTHPLDGVIRVYQDGRVDIYEDQRALPRAFAVAAAVTVASPEAAFQAMLQPGFDIHTVHFVEAPPGALPAALAVTDDTAPSLRPVEIDHLGGNRVELTVNAERTELVVLTDAFYPGWRAYVDGQKAPIYRIDGALRGVVVEPGVRHVVFRYWPPRMAIGLTSSVLATGLCLLLILIPRRIHRLVEITGEILVKIAVKTSEILAQYAVSVLLITIWATIVILRQKLLTPYFGPIVADEVSYRLYTEHLGTYPACAVNIVCDLSLANKLHYPPLYPLLLSVVGWLSSYPPLGAIKLTNIVISSAIIFPVYAIARQILSRDLALAASLVTGMLPSGIILSPSLMSENLYIPLFALSFWLVIRQRPATLTTALFFGTVLVLGFLTNFRHLILMPFLGLTFMINQWLLLRSVPSQARAVQLGRLLAMTSVVPVASVIAWIGYVITSGEPVAPAFSVAALPVNGAQNALDPALFMPLLALHGLSIVGSILPCLPVIVILVLTWKRGESDSPINIYLISLLVMTGVQWIFISDIVLESIRMVTEVSGASHVTLATLPVSVGERYFMMLVPLFVPLAFAGLERMMVPMVGTKQWWPLGVASGVSLGLALLVQAGLYDRTLWPIPASVTVNGVTAADNLYGALGFSVVAVTMGAVGILIALVWSGSVSQRLKPFEQRVSRLVTIGAVTVGLAAFNGFTGLVGANFVWNAPIRQITTGHAQGIAAIIGDRNHDSRPVLVSFEPTANEAIRKHIGISKSGLRMALTHRLTLWAGRPVTVVNARVPGDDRPRYWISFTRPQDDPAGTYQVGDERFQVSTVAPVFPPTATLAVSNFGPHETTVGRGFNILPDGTSALWIQLMRSDPSASLLPDEIIMTWDGEPLKSTYIKSLTLLTAEVSKDRYDAPGHHDVAIIDTDTEATIAHLDFIVK